MSELNNLPTLNIEEVKEDLKLDGNGNVKPTLNNYLTIYNQDNAMRHQFAYNELSRRIECPPENYALWDDHHDIMLSQYLESAYGISNYQRQFMGVQLIAKENHFHPVRQRIEKLVWDGIPRMEGMLTKYLGAADTPYVREVSRLIFAGGIARAYEPGCKFDTMPVLIGRRQGEGKSTFVRWLAMDDRFFREVGEIEGQKGMEAIQGGWICEMSELLALKRTKDVEAVKSYISRQCDSYRQPYERRVSDNPRQCIFIGTTNSTTFLTDRSGNRRYLPVECLSSGRELYAKQEECQADIEQCWAEAYQAYQAGNLPTVPDSSLTEEIFTQQALAVEEDYRIGMIAEYLENRQVVCILELWRNALLEVGKPAKRDSIDLGMIMDSFPEWKRTGKTMRYQNYGSQKIWEKQQIH